MLLKHTSEKDLKMKMLEINNLQVNYGPVIAVKKVDLFVNQGETVFSLGDNGE